MAPLPSLQEITFPRWYPRDIDKKAYKQFLASIAKNTDIDFAVIHLPGCGNDLLTGAVWQHNKKAFRYYWEQPSVSFAIAASGILTEIKAKGKNRFTTVNAQYKTVCQKTAQFNAAKTNPCIHFLGGFSFFDEISGAEWKDYDAASFSLAELTAVKRSGDITLSVAIALPEYRSPIRLHQLFLARLQPLYKKREQTQATPAAPEDSLSVLTAHAQRNQWEEAILNAREAIAGQRMEKVVLARQLKLKKHPSIQADSILQQLRVQYPHCTTFCIQKPDGPAFIGCSPEKLLSFKGDDIETEALAGSIGRGKSKVEDKRLATELSLSQKNIQEHQYVVQSLTENLESLVKTLQYPAKPSIKKLANVQHLHTPVAAQKRKDVHPLSLLGRLHPTPAMGGFPRDEANRYIKHHEPFSRGWFASPVGWLNSDNEGEFTVAIRSGLISETEALLFAGCGIVADSDPESEWQETNLKFMPMLSALNYD